MIESPIPADQQQQLLAIGIDEDTIRHIAAETIRERTNSSSDGNSLSFYGGLMFDGDYQRELEKDFRALSEQPYIETTVETPRRFLTPPKTTTTREDLSPVDMAAEIASYAQRLLDSGEALTMRKAAIILR